MWYWTVFIHMLCYRALHTATITHTCASNDTHNRCCSTEVVTFIMKTEVCRAHTQASAVLYGAVLGCTVRYAYRCISRYFGSTSALKRYLIDTDWRLHIIHCFEISSVQCRVCVRLYTLFHSDIFKSSEQRYRLSAHSRAQHWGKDILFSFFFFFEKF